MATIYQYRNTSTRNYVHLPDGTLIDPGQTRWTYHNITGNPSLELVDSKDDGAPTVTEAMVATIVAEYFDSHPEVLNAAVADYISKHPAAIISGDDIAETGEDN